MESRRSNAACPFEETALDTVLIASLPLSIEAAVAAVSDPSCGAIATFLGTTRNNHAGRRVLGLTYEAHESMAVRVMREIVSEARERSGGRICRAYVAHRVGEVPVESCSVSSLALMVMHCGRGYFCPSLTSPLEQILIAMSSPHRSDAQVRMQGSTLQPS